MKEKGIIEMSENSFGGKWTVEKLNILSNYLSAYLDALKNKPFKKIYVDAFAGTGKITIGDVEEEIVGSVRLALNRERRFDRYIFIEKKKRFARELQTIVDTEYLEIKDRIIIKNEDCNAALLEICKKTNWSTNRAILFLDPYATEVKWDTLMAVAATKAFDVWYLFPFSAAQRMMKNDGEIDESWRLKLNSLFGDKGWYDRFYTIDPQINLFGEESKIKNINANELSIYITERLETIFPAVARKPRLFYNTKNSPLFLFCFAVANDNPKACNLALRIANHILKDKE